MSPEIRFADEQIVSVPGPQSWLTVRRNDWAALKRHVRAIVPELGWLSAAGTTLVGAGASGFFSSLGFTMIEAAHRPAWLLPVAWSLTTIWVVVGVTFLILAGRERTRMRTSVDDIVEEMRQLESSANAGGVGEGSGGLEVVDAKYGEGTDWKDVTSIVASRLLDGTVVLPVSNDMLGPDPAPNRVKSLKVRYRVGGRDEVRTIREGNLLRLP